MKPIIAISLITLAILAFMSGGQANQQKKYAERYKAERDSLLVSLDCPPKMNLVLPTSRCLNDSKTHDFDRYVSKLVLLCGDTLEVHAFCDACYPKLSAKKKAELLVPVLDNYFEQERKALESGLKHE